MIGKFDDSCDCDKYSLQNGAPSTLSVGSGLIVVGVKLFDSSALMSFTEIPSILFSLFDRL